MNVYAILLGASVWLNTAGPLQPEDLRGRVLLLDFWTFCCINCMHVIPDLHYLEQRFGSKLTVIGVHSAKFANERDTENIRQAMLRYDITHPVVNDSNFAVWKALRVRAWPTLMLVNPEGEVERVYAGEGHREEIERDIERLLRRYGDAVNDTPLPVALEKDKAPATFLRFPGKIIHVPDWSGAPALIVSDSGNHRLAVLGMDGAVREIIGSGAAGRRDGDFAQAQFHSPQGLAWHGGMLYVADTANHLLRAADAKARAVSTLAGTGAQGYERDAMNRPALATPLASPWDVAMGPGAGQLSIAMAGTHQLWRYDLNKRTLSVIAGNGRESIDDGAAPFNSLSQPSGLSLHDGKLWFVDAETSSLRVYENGRIRTLIGTGLFDFGFRDGRQGEALMQHPLGVYADATGVYIADAYNHAIRRYDPAGGRLETLAGTGQRGAADGPFNAATFNEPNAITRAGDLLLVADTNNHAVRMLDLKKRSVTTLPVRDARAASGALPNLLPVDRLHVRVDASSTLILALPARHKINAEAPSALSLRTAEGEPRDLAVLDTEALKEGRAILPPLAAGAYRLQGSLYYCEDSPGAPCRIASLDAVLTADTKGESRFTIPLPSE